MLFTLAVAAAPPPAARADTLIHPTAGARNLAQGESSMQVLPSGQILQGPGWLAWAQPAEQGRWRLMLRSPQGATTSPAIPDFGAPPDPDTGSDRLASGAQRLFVVYSRCAGTSTTAGCDVCRYDVVGGSEEKVATISTAAASETAPSVRLGVWSFVRRGSGASRPGVYVSTPRPGRTATVPGPRTRDRPGWRCQSRRLRLQLTQRRRCRRPARSSVNTRSVPPGDPPSWQPKAACPTTLSQKAPVPVTRP